MKIKNEICLFVFCFFIFIIFPSSFVFRFILFFFDDSFGHRIDGNEVSYIYIYFFRITCRENVLFTWKKDSKRNKSVFFLSLHLFSSSSFVHLYLLQTIWMTLLDCHQKVNASHWHCYSFIYLFSSSFPVFLS